MKNEKILPDNKKEAEEQGAITFVNIFRLVYYFMFTYQINNSFPLSLILNFSELLHG